MTEQTRTGGPAFPFPAYTYQNGEINHGEGGMTLRDYFAGQFATSIPQRVWEDASGNTPTNVLELWAKGCYAASDALMKERAK